MSTAQLKMLSALNDWVVPYLIKKGFKGSFSTFRRHRPDCVEIITFQFTAFDSSFCVNLAKCPLRGITFRSGEYIPANCITAHHCAEKFCLGVTGDHISHWFNYNPSKHLIKLQQNFPSITMYGDSLLKYKQISDDIISLIDTQGESWWSHADDWWFDIQPDYNHLFFAIQDCNEIARRNSSHRYH